MPTIQIPGIKEPVSFSDDLTHEQLVEAVDNAWKSQFKEDEVDFQRGRLGSAAASFGRAVTEGIGQVVSGLGRVESMLTAGAAQPEGEAYTSPEDRQRIQAESPISKAGEAIQQGAKEAYRTNPKFQGEFLAETLPQALGSTAISAAAAGVGGPVVGGAAYGLMSGEQAAKEAEDAGKPNQSDIAFLLNAPVGALSESLLGAGPRFWKTVKAVREAGVEPAKAIPSLLKIAAKSSAYEGSQEGIEQLAQNAIAQRLYDPNRPITQGVVESVKAGAAVGGLLGGAGAAVGGIDSKVAKTKIAVKTAEDGAPATGLAILQTQTKTPESKSIDVSGIQQEVEKLNSLIEEAKRLQAQGQALTDEQAKKIAVLEKSRQKGEMIDEENAPETAPAEPTVVPPLSDGQQAHSGPRFSAPPVPDTFNSIDELIKYRDSVKEAEIKYFIELGMSPSDALRYYKASDATSNIDVSSIEKKLSKESQDALDRFNRESSAYEQDKAFSPDALSGETDVAELAKAVVNAVLSGDNISGTIGDRQAYVYVALEQLKNSGGTWFDIAKVLDNRTTRESGSQSDKEQLFKQYGTRIKDFVKRFNVSLPLTPSTTTSSSNADQIKIAMEVAGSEPTGPAAQVAEGKPGGPVEAAGTKVEEEGARVQGEVKSPETPPTFEGGWVSSEPEANPTSAAFGYDGDPVTGTKNAIVDAERLIRGAAEIAPEEVQGNEETLRRGLEIAQDDPQRVDEIIEKLQNREHRSISVEDEAALVGRKLIWMNKRSLLESVILDPNASTEQKAIAQAEWDALESEMDRMDRATKASGAEWGRFGQFRSRAFREDYTLEPMLRRKRVALNRPLTVEEAQKVKEMSEKILEQERKIEELRKKAQEKQSSDAFDEAFKRIEQEESQSEKETTSPQVVSLAERIVKTLEDQAGKARIRLREKLMRASSGIDPTILSDVVIIGTAKLARGALDFARWSTSMRNDLGEKVDPYLDEAWKQSNERLDKTVESFAGKEKANSVRSALKPSTPVEKISLFNERLKEKVSNGAEFQDVSGSLEKLARFYWKSGVRSRDEVIDKVHADVKAVLPTITRRNVMDAISGYGKFTELSKDEADVSFRQAKGEMQQLGKIEDMKAGIAPRKTGVERREPNPEERKLIKQVNELKKQGGFIVTDPERQLKTAQDAVKTRLRNEIVDLDNAIEKNERLVTKKSALEYDQEAKDLRARRDELKKEYDKLFPKEGKTREQQIADANRVLDQTIKRLTEGEDVKKAKAEKVSTSEIEAKRARIDELRAVKDFLNKADIATREKAAIERLNKRKAELEKAVQEAKTRPSSEGMDLPKEKPLSTPAIDAIKEDIKAIQKELDAIERGPLPTEDEVALARKKASLARSIAKYKERIANNQFSSKPKQDVKTDDEIRLLTLEQNKVKKEFNEGLLKDRLAQRSQSQVIIDTARETANVVRNMMTGYEFSAVGKQGLFFSASHPFVAMRAMGDMFRALSSEAQASMVMEEIADRPNADLYKQAKLFLADTDSHSLNKVEEAYLGRWASKLPFNTAFQRAFTVFLNKMRADVFDLMAASVSARDRGLTLDQAKAIANFVNVATGRGSLGSFEASAKNLATIFFAPRYSVSRFQLLLGQPFLKGGGAAVNKAIAAEYARAAIGIATFTAMVAAYYDNDPIELDPRSSDFLKIKVGKTRIDPYAGLAQATTFLSRELSGYTKNQRGQLVPIRGKVPFGKDDAWTVATRFGRTKLSPVFSTAADLASGHDMVGQPVTPSTILVRSAIPITYGDVYQAIKEHGFNEKSLPMIMMSLFGVGMNTYQDRPRR